jgi:C-terminal processing protease CtpA/Prc
MFPSARNGETMRVLVRIALVATVILGVAWAAEKKYRALKTEEMLQMLDTAQADIKDHYYDPAIHGLDLVQRFDKARKEIAGAKSQDEGLLDIAAAVASVNDSHTRFNPPVRPYGVDYGWLMEAIGDSACFVTAVRPESDAAAKGLKPGDQIISVNGIAVTRQDIGFIEYAYHVVPQSGLHMLVRSPDGAEQALVARATVVPGQEIVRHSDVMTWLRNYHGSSDRSQYYSKDGVLFWRLPDFLLDPSDVDGLLDRTHSYRTLVLDLRGNPGGLTEALRKFVGGFFDHDIKLADEKGREGVKPEMARSRRQKAFTGKLIVLVDSSTASAAEIFSRVVQLENRGIVLGDRSRGAVMQGRVFVHAAKLDATNVAQYGVEVSTEAMIMADGQSLEGVGVIPNEKILPSPADLVHVRDPVLARAAELGGVRMTPEEAGRILPFKWPKERMPEID